MIEKENNLFFKYFVDALDDGRDKNPFSKNMIELEG